MNTLEQRIHRLEMIAEVQRLIGLYAKYFSAHEFDKIPSLFAMDQENLRAEMLWGVYEGADGINRLYQGYYPSIFNSVSNKTLENLQTMEVPIIRAAKDGLTAKAVWVCPGYATVVTGAGKTQAIWSWQKCACDFIYTESGLKMWHFHVYGLFESPFLSFDVFPSGKIVYHEDVPPEFAPDKPPTTVFEYSADSIYPYAPAVPRPYITFDQDYAY